MAVSNVAAAEGFQLRQFAGTFQLEQGMSSSLVPATVMSDNGNTGTVDVTGTITVVGPMNTEVCNRPSGGIFAP